MKGCMEEATFELDPERCSNFAQEREANGYCRKGGCVLEQCTVLEWEPKETCRRVMDNRPGLEHGGKGGASEQILSFGAWAFAVVFNPDNLFYKREMRKA